MSKLKQILKENRIILLVAVIVLVLFGYKQLNPTDYKYVSESKVQSMLDKDKDFILVVGMDSYDEEEDADLTDYTSETSEQNTYIKQYIKDHHQKVYYLSSDDVDDINAFLEDTMGSDSTELPQTFFIINGEVDRSKTGTLKSYDFSKIVKDWKEKK